MSKVIEKITQIKSYLKTLSKNQQIAEDLDYFTFLATLIPVPGYQQAALLVNKLVANHNLNLLIIELQDSIYQTNTRITTMENEIEKIQSMANTVEFFPDLTEKINLIFEQAKQELTSEFIVETENWSTQTIINQIINAEFTSVSANNNSHNRLQNVEINSKRTHLRAVDHSSNYLQGTDFKDSIGTVSMNNVIQTGNVQVTGNSVSLFANTDKVKGYCPNCSNIIRVNRIEIQGYSHIRCSQCKGMFKLIH